MTNLRYNRQTLTLAQKKNVVLLFWISAFDWAHLDKFSQNSTGICSIYSMGPWYFFLMYPDIIVMFSEFCVDVRKWLFFLEGVGGGGCQWCQPFCLEAAMLGKSEGLYCDKSLLGILAQMYPKQKKVFNSLSKFHTELMKSNSMTLSYMRLQIFTPPPLKKRFRSVWTFSSLSLLDNRWNKYHCQARTRPVFC